MTTTKTNFDIQDLLKRKDVTGLVDALEQGDNKCRKAAAGALAKLADKGAVDGLIVALADQNMDVRQATAEALGKIGDQRAVGPLITALNDTTDYPVFKVPLEVPCSNIDARGEAALALAKIGGNAAIEALQEFSDAGGNKGVYRGLSVTEAVQKALAELGAAASNSDGAQSPQRQSLWGGSGSGAQSRVHRN